VHSPQSLKLMTQAVQDKIILHLDPLVLAECVFVLTKVYRITKNEVVDKLLRLLDFSAIQSQDKQVLIVALNIYSELNIDFVDAYLSAKTKCHKDDTVVTYNVKDFKKAGAEYTTPDDPILYE
jgi:predicted nucleic-acid-binding protein